VTGYQDIEADPGEADKRLLVYEPEFALVLRVMAREGNSLSAILRQAWDSGNLRTLTRNSPLKATGAHVSIIAHVTRAELLRYLDSTEMANGFANRFLWLCVSRSKCLPDDEDRRVDEHKLEPLTRRLVDAVQFANGVGEMGKDAQACADWRAVYPALSEGKPGMLGAVTSRAEAQTMRVGCLYALLDKSERTRREHLRAALAVWSYCEQSAAYIFGQSLGDPLADTILQALKQNSAGLSRTDISNLLGRHKDAAQIGRALAALRESGKVRAEFEETEGRKAERWFAI
jgi:DNA-binding transcriptional ArsR family regulator